MNQIYTKSVIGIGSLIDRFTASQCSPINLDPKVGDFVRIGFEISEGQKTRIQFYQGLVLGVKGVGITRSILVRRSFKGFCSERVVLLNSPQIKEFKRFNGSLNPLIKEFKGFVGSLNSLNHP